jgi:D-alanyl-D-alanine endopeptidase (penicillin-binding protein 7)
MTREGVVYRTVRKLLAGAVLGALSLCITIPGVTLAQSARAKAVSDRLGLKSSSVLVLDQASGQVLYGKNPQAVVPIASLTKLMTAMVVLDADLEPEEPIAISEEDVDWLRGSHSRLRVGTVLTRDDLLRLTLMASENRAASALARAHPGGRPQFVQAMNEKARVLGLGGTHYAESTGLSSANVSTAEDLAVIAETAFSYPKIRDYSTLRGHDVPVAGRTMAFRNTNGLVASPQWQIGLSKTGFINEAGRCLVMQAKLAGREIIIVLLDSWGRYSRLADANRIRKWMEAAAGIKPAPVKAVKAVKATAKKMKSQLSASRSRGRST